MPKIQVTITNEIHSKILANVQKKLQEGLTEREANVSNETFKLIELGLRVQGIQESKKDSPFNELEFYREVLRQLSITNASTQRILEMTSLNTEIADIEKYEFSKMMKDIKTYKDDVVGHFFGTDEESE